ncbi:hypothetical protein SAMN05877809_103179 [Rhodobacter sp. JA431]|uniref:hypothetical protein n=1 Tax=Rhodobacter sp. JA431 TaxID=570013 RepID=UPI000BD37114|nr:hypothetical protein [Rhodobacter sp. JA431]SOC04338.1 hypothetical protein SAMN05877809_103179 [Rhodobacter sp. JA431]
MNDEGGLEKIYDFKFDAPQTGYVDDWQEKQMQEQAYEKALPDGVEPEKVDNETCECDRKPGKKGPIS